MVEGRKRKLKEELRSSWFIPLRLAIFLLLFGAMFLSGGGGRDLFLPFLLYSITTILFLLLAEANADFIKPWLVHSAIFLHIAIELAVECSLLNDLEHLTSQYTILFLLTIVSASLAYRLVGTLLVAGLASVAFTARISQSALAVVSPLTELDRLGETISSSDDVFYAIFLHVCTFFLVAFISGFLSEKLQAKEGELTNASRRLELARLDTDEILLNLHSGILTIDNRGRVVYFNRAAESILGMHDIDARGRSFMEIFNKRMPELVERVLGVLKVSQPSIRTELEITGQEGNAIPLGLTASALGDERVGVRGVIAIFQDLTQAKKLEGALMRADRLAAVGELSARIAHEIRNPLASISGSVEVLKSELELSGENQRLMDLIVKESERLSRVLSDFLCYSRNKPTVRSKVELVSVVGETIELLRHDLDVFAGTEISLQTDLSTAYIVAEEDQLREVLINLIGNAVDAITGPDGKVEVAISEPIGWEDISPMEWITLSVLDNGDGFDPDDRDRIFDPFFSRKKGGTGLGLAIVRRCCDNLGAKIKVDTEPGGGSTFSILLHRYLSGIDSSHLLATAEQEIPA